MVIINDYYVDMTASELKRWLKKQGCTFTEGKKHTFAHLGENQILKDLGLKK